MDINKAKSIVLATLFVVTLFSCLLPLKLIDTIRNVVDPVRKLRYSIFPYVFMLVILHTLFQSNFVAGTQELLVC